MKIVILGKPGSGKDTLANKLAELHDYKVLTTGALYRKEYELKTDFGIKAHSYWGNGNLCPDDMTNELMLNSTRSINIDDKIIFNGYPRTYAQAKFLDSITKINLVIDLIVPDEKAINRLLARGRLDDTRETISNRLKVYNDNNMPLVNYYRSINIYHQVSTDRNREETLSDTLNLIIENAKL